MLNPTGHYRVGAVTCWIQQSVSPKQVVGFSCLFNSEVDQLISKVIVLPMIEDHRVASLAVWGNFVLLGVASTLKTIRQQTKQNYRVLICFLTSAYNNIHVNVDEMILRSM